MHITSIECADVRCELPPGDGADAVHGNPVYSYATALLRTDAGHTGVGLAFTLGAGNDLVCRAVEELGVGLVGREIDELMAEFGKVSQSLADHPQYRWLGPHKGVVHLALAALSNACFDLWAKHRGVPLWRLLLDLSPAELVATLDLTYLARCRLPGI
jgi:L-fuconate dehydratase